MQQRLIGQLVQEPHVLAAGPPPQPQRQVLALVDEPERIVAQRQLDASKAAEARRKKKAAAQGAGYGSAIGTAIGAYYSNPQLGGAIGGGLGGAAGEKFG